MFAVVQNQEHLSFLDVFRNPLHWRAVGLIGESEGGGDLRTDQGVVIQSREFNGPHTVSKGLPCPGGQLRGQAGLADAAGADKG